MRGTGQSAFTHAKLHIKARKNLGEAPKTAAEGKSLKLVKEFSFIFALACRGTAAAHRLLSAQHRSLLCCE